MSLPATTLPGSVPRPAPDGPRFAFGENWTRFLRLLSDERIAAAERSLREALGDLEGRTFCDVGCGSGLFSLAARRLSARVHSFDFDAQSVACAERLRARFFPDDPHWTIARASLLDADHVRRLGRFDVVYCWGVAHHTGRLWQALEHLAPLVRPGGLLHVAVYNTQPRWTPAWTRLKRAYAHGGTARRAALLALLGAVFAVRRLARSLRAAGRRAPVAGHRRGMSWRHDVVDWIGGYPFETARPEEVFDFFRTRGFVLERLRTVGGGHGNNEYLFRREPGGPTGTVDGGRLA